MNLFKELWHGILVDFHVNKGNRIGIKYLVARNYHFDLAKYHYQKAYGREFKE